MAKTECCANCVHYSIVRNCELFEGLCKFGLIVTGSGRSKCDDYQERR